jgi:hypothetical protein
MVAIVAYKCETCEEVYSTVGQCAVCEASHVANTVDKHRYVVPKVTGKYPSNSISAYEIIHEHNDRVYYMTATGMHSKLRDELEMDYIFEDSTDNLSVMLLSSDKEARVLAKTLIHEKVKQLKNANNTNGKESSEA